MAAGVTVTLQELIKLQHLAPGIKLTHQRRVRNARAGGYVSQFRGRGIDFDEVRSYQPGDDIRLLDWRVTARTGKPHTKLFREERERTVLLVVDNSASMQFGTRVAFKSVIAARAAAMLAWSAMRAGDRIGGLVFAEGYHYEIPPDAGQAGVLPLLKALSSPPANQRHSNLISALKRLRAVARTGSLIFLISDFYQWDDECQTILGQLAQHNDIAGIHIYDILEQSLPAKNNLYRFAHGQQKLMIDSADKTLRQAYTAQFTQRLQQLQHFMRTVKMPLISLATDDILQEKL